MDAHSVQSNVILVPKTGRTITFHWREREEEPLEEDPLLEEDLKQEEINCSSKKVFLNYELQELIKEVDLSPKSNESSDLYRKRVQDAIEEAIKKIKSLENKLEDSGLRRQSPELSKKITSFEHQVDLLRRINIAILSFHESLPFILQQNIVDLLLCIPDIHDSNNQRTLLYSAGLEQQLQNQLSSGLPALQFAHNLVKTLSQYGNLEDGRNALEAILEATKRFVGQEQRKCCDMLIQQLHDVKKQ